MTAHDMTTSFYDDLADNYHLIFADWRGSMRWQAEALDKLIRKSRPASVRRILDCACGIGTQAIGLAQLDYDVTGTDISRRSVDRAAREATLLGAKSATFAEADMRHLGDALSATFDAVIACDNSLPHLLTDADLAQACRSIRSKLQLGGLFMASIRDYDQLLQTRPEFEGHRFLDDPEYGKRIIFQRWQWRTDKPLYEISLFILREADGRWITHCYTSQYRALTRAELTDALTASGFESVQWHTPESAGYYQPVVTALAR
jgi:glycine/sarcosine N-methyltransferase